MKKVWNRKGRRRFLYIGHTGAAKGTDFLCALAEASAAANTGMEFGWIGGGFLGSAAIEALGAYDFHLEESRRMVAGYDFVIHCGRSDANPTTVLEAVSWGLVPVCTVESGYDARRGEEWVVNIPLDDVEGAMRVLWRLNQMEEEELEGFVRRGRSALDRHFTWQRFGREVAEAIAGEVPVRPREREWEMRAAENKRRLREICEGRK
jgi:glycosyltransferase involved in cell wall biosynthesis